MIQMLKKSKTIDINTICYSITDSLLKIETNEIRRILIITTKTINLESMKQNLKNRISEFVINTSKDGMFDLITIKKKESKEEELKNIKLELFIVLKSLSIYNNNSFEFLKKQIYKEILIFVQNEYEYINYKKIVNEYFACIILNEHTLSYGCVLNKKLFDNN